MEAIVLYSDVYFKGPGYTDMPVNSGSPSLLLLLNLNRLMITFKECQKYGYPARTLENAQADMTIAIADYFETAGEKLTKRLVLQSNKIYVPVHYNSIKLPSLIVRVSSIVAYNQPTTLNIAGNGAYSFTDPQEVINENVLSFLHEIFKRSKHKPKLIRSGGQTGIDEAGLLAAQSLGIKAYCLAPKNWLFKDAKLQTFSNEKLFKARFK